MKVSIKFDVRRIDLKKEWVYKAYRKLKSNVYYDSNSSFLKLQICEFEDTKNIDSFVYNIFPERKITTLIQKLDAIAEILENEEQRSHLFELILENINFHCVPKKINHLNEKNTTIISNDLTNTDADLNKATYIIDLPLEAHILGVLWILLGGYKLQEEYEQWAYGNILEDDKMIQDSSLRLFKKYYKQYEKWRDNAINEVKHILDTQHNSILLSIDIKDYFYSALIDFENLKGVLNSKLNKEDDKEILLELTDLIKNIHDKYSSYFYFKYLNSKSKEKDCIPGVPIGFLPSGIISNWYLVNFDKMVLDKLNPNYYGRYVDDILIVLPYYGYPNLNNSKELLQELLINKGTMHKCLFNGEKFVNIDDKLEDILEVISCDKFLKMEIIESLKTENDGFIKKNKVKDLNSLMFKEKNDFSINMLDIIKHTEKKNFIKYIFEKVDFEKKENVQHLLCINGYKNNLFIQEEKIKVHYFNYRGPDAIINNFKNEIRKNSSEFRFFPEKETIFESFNYEVFQLKYSDTINKIRSIEGVGVDKYALSKYLAKIIYLDKLEDSDALKKISNQILNIFKNGYSIEFFNMWEKAISFYVINNNFIELSKLINNIYYAINRLKTNKIDKFQMYSINDSKEIHVTIIDRLRQHLLISLAMGLALNDYKYNEAVHKKIFKNAPGIIRMGDLLDKLKSLIKIIRNANMTKHYLISNPLLNYTTWYSKKVNGKANLNLLEPYGHHEDNDLDNLLIWTTPRFVHLHECILYSYHKMINQYGKEKNGEIPIKNTDILKEAIKNFTKFNDKHTLINPMLKSDTSHDKPCVLDQYIKIKSLEELSEEMPEKLLEELSNKNTIHRDFSIYHRADILQQKFVDVNFYKIRNNSIKSKVRIALANIKVPLDDLRNNLLLNPNISSKRLEMISQILNTAVKEKSDIIIFPEVSVPYTLLPAFADFSRRNNVAIICGVEHVVNPKKYAFNFIATILPFSMGKYTSTLITLRLKNHYAPAEISLIDSLELKIPHLSKPSYDLFVWEDVYFTCYNCFELTNIIHRGIFKSHIDLLIACEHNPDINYFADIVESVTRDVHCYVAQVNHSEYGDSRVLVPCKTEKKDIVKIKGGENSCVLVGEIDIRKLRDFQIKQYNAQLTEKTFKPCPPDFKRENVKLRMGLKLPEEL